MDDHRRETLIALGAEALADHMLALGESVDDAAALIHRLTSSPDELLESFTVKLELLKEEEYWIDWDDTDLFAHRLTLMVDELVASAVTPEIGLRLVTEFFLCDEAIMKRCDDSSGVVGNVFTDSLTHLFHTYAKEVKDRQVVIDALVTLTLDDKYGVRDTLITHARESLREDEVRTLIAHFQHMIETSLPACNFRVVMNMMGSLAEQINDVDLYEHIILSSFGLLTELSLFTLATMHIERGEFDEALARLEQIAPGYNYKRNQLLREIYQGLGNQEQLIALHKETFDHSKSNKDFEQLIAVVGESYREELMKTEIGKIMANPTFTMAELRLLSDMGNFEETERYLFKHADEVDGDSYYSLLPIAERLIAQRYYRSATLIIRKLLESILRRGYSKAYGHGVDYLDTLDELALHIDEWAPLEEHSTYKENLYTEHKRKYSFWNQYKGSSR